MFRGRVRHAHFVGIGGIGMSGLAEILRTMEFDVSGSDLRENEVTRRLATMGVRIDVGHRADNVKGADVLVYSSAIKQDNPELARARALEVPIISRGEMLAELMRSKYCVTIAGSHGKTTTTSMVATVLRRTAWPRRSAFRHPAPPPAPPCPAVALDRPAAAARSRAANR